MAKTDIAQLKSGEVGAFVYSKNDLATAPKFLGFFSENLVETLNKAKGDLEAIYAKGTRPGEIYIVDTLRGAPQLGELGVRERVRPEAYNYLERIYKSDCPVVFLIKMDECGNLDSRTSFQSYWIVDAARLNNIEIENLQRQLDGSQPMVEMSGTLNHLTFERLLPIKFSAYAESTLLAEAIDVIYFDDISCGACSAASDGCEKIAFLTRANTGSPGLSGQIVYTLDNKETWATKDLPTLGGLDPRRMAAVDQYIVVISEADGSLSYFTKADIATSTVSQVTSGFVGGGAPRSIYAKSPNEVFMGGAGGYIYKSEDITLGVDVVHDGSLTVQNSNDIHGYGQTVVSVHNSNVILYSQNNGLNMSLLSTPPEVGANLTAIWCKTAYQWYVGTNTGKLWFTENAGATWTQRLLPNQSDLVVINDIKFDPDLGEIGAIAAETINAGYVYRSFSGGREWSRVSPYVSELPTNRRINAVALCGVNEVAAAGLKSGSTDGLAAVAL